MEILEFCSLDHMKDMMAGKLNVAQKKRLEIARALATDPKLLLLDETMAGLTATERKDAVELIRKINAKGITVLTIEHNMDVVMNVSNRVVVLVSGRTVNGRHTGRDHHSSRGNQGISGGRRSR